MKTKLKWTNPLWKPPETKINKNTELNICIICVCVCHLAATVCTGPTLPSLSGSRPPVRTIWCSGPSQPEPRPWSSSSSSPASTGGQTAAALKRLTDRKPASRRLSGSSHLHQVDVARLFGRPPRLSLQSVHVVQRPLPHRGEVAMLVTQLIPVVGLERQTGRETEIFYCHFSWVCGR